MDNQTILDGVASAALTAPSYTVFADAYALLSVMREDRPETARAYARWFRTRAEDRVMCTDDVTEAEAVMEMVERILREFASSDFDSYMLFMEWRREPVKQFYRPRRHVLLPLVGDLQDLYDGKLDLLAISMPPRTGKSTLCIFFLTFVMGNRPERANVMSGHSDKLTKGFHTEAQSIIRDGETYRFGEVFPESPVVYTSAAEETIHLASRRRFPTLTCRSIDGTLTGAVEVGRGALLYCDDLVSDREEALNTERMEKLYQAYLNQLKDRMNDGACQLFVATRWTPDDPIGRIAEQYGGNPRYRFTVLPALNADGESNFTYHHNLGFSTAYYEDMRESLYAAGEGDSWDAKYQGNPRYVGGLLFDAGDLRYYDALPDGEPDGVIAACDTKDRGKDFCAMPVVAVYGDDHYLIDVVYDNRLPELVEPRLVDALVDNGVTVARFESNAAGGRVARDVKRECADRGHAVDIRAVYSTDNKETRILLDSPWVKTRVLFPKHPDSEDMERFIKALNHYSTEGRNPHDDAPDSLSMLKRLATSLTANRVKAVKRVI